MAEHCNHTIHKHHLGWNNANEPALSIASGETIEFRTIDSSGRQLTQKSTAADVATLDFAKVNPVSGPIYIEDAEPGDAVKVTLLDFTPSGWGWTANVPGFGLLADQFKEPALHIWTYDIQRMAPAAETQQEAAYPRLVQPHKLAERRGIACRGAFHGQPIVSHAGVGDIR